MRLEEARRVADIVVDLLAPACTKIEVAGSVRREKPDDIKDIEIVALPDTAPARLTFGGPKHRNRFEAYLAEVVAGGVLRIGEKNGLKYKTLVHRDTGTKVDLFLANPDNYGCIMAIRTGDAAFSHYLVTDRWRGGLMPDFMRQRSGYLQRVRSGMEMSDDEDVWERIPCPDEAAFFAALGFHDVPLPSVRDWAFAQGLRRPIERKGAA